ncbi:hypothetical protein ACS0TY_035754 [Phlomoides rotata]
MGNTLSSKNQGRDGDKDSLITSVSNNVNEEYKQAFRTTSYMEILNKVHDHLDDVHSAAASPSPPPTQNSHLSRYLLDPHQESLITSISDSSNPNHQFLANYFKVSLEASRVCESLLTNIHHARINHRRIKKVIKLIKRLPEGSNPSSGEYRVLHENLSSFASRRNPFSTMDPGKFHKLHDTHEVLFRELTTRCRKISRRKKMIKLIKRGIASFLVMGCGAFFVVLLILLMHCSVGLVGVLGLVMWFTMAKKIQKMRRKCDEKRLEGVLVKLDIAAKGVYIMINDFGTMSQIVKRLRDEYERRKYLVGVCVGKGKNEMLKKVVREFQMRESWFVEVLEELERQICLCFLDINRSIRLIISG